MKNSRQHIISLLILILCVPGVRCMGSARGDSLDLALKTLDEVLSKKELFNREYQKKITEARKAYDPQSDLQEQYDALRQLYNVYRSYKIDSALIVADRRVEVAREIGEPVKIASATLNLAEGYAKSGNPEVAIMILDSLNPGFMEGNQQQYRDGIYKTAYTLKLANALLSKDRMLIIEKLRLIRRNELLEKDRNSRGFLTLSAEQLKEAGMIQEAAAKMEEASNKFGFEGNAPLLYMMGEVYLDAGKEEDGLLALSKAATLDISEGTREYKALILLAAELFKRGDVSRAFEYINYAFEDAEFSQATLRTDEIMEIMPVIHDAFYQKEREINRITTWFLIGAGILIVILVIVLILLGRAVKANHKMIKTIEDINNKLTIRNRTLEESDGLKLEILNGFMMDYARYISRVRSFRKNIYRLIKTCQYDKAIDAVKSDKVESPDISAFQEMFDVAFHSMFPDFIEKLNKFLSQPIELRDNMRLSPEARIAALMRLGITSTDEIADMFHYSAQSVYNLRSTLRGMLNLSWEEFEKEIRKI